MHFYSRLIFISMYSLSVTSSCLAWQSEATSTTKQQVLVVLGASGEDDYGAQFREWGERWKKACQEHDFQLIDGTQGDQEGDLESILKWIDTARVDSNQWLVFIGHGTHSRSGTRFNLRGKDLSSEQLAKSLAGKGGRWVVIDCSSSSGPFINAISGEGRIVITATKSGSEQNYSRFGSFLSLAISDLSADLDHDKNVSVLEAFLAASGRVNEFYSEEDRLASEQALLDDNGDKKGTPAAFYRGVRPVKAPADGLELDGKLANRISLSAAANSLSPENSSKREKIEKEIDTLRTAKKSMDEDAYYLKLEELFVALAGISN